MLILDYDSETKAKQQAELVIRRRARAECSQEIASNASKLHRYIENVGYAACMKVEGLLGMFKCKGQLKDANSCLKQQYAN